MFGSRTVPGEISLFQDAINNDGTVDREKFMFAMLQFANCFGSDPTTGQSDNVLRGPVIIEAKHNDGRDGASPAQPSQHNFATLKLCNTFPAPNSHLPVGCIDNADKVQDHGISGNRETVNRGLEGGTEQTHTNTYNGYALLIPCGCGITKLGGPLQVDGPSIFNECVVFNSNVAVYGCMTNVRNGHGSTMVRFCLTSGFDVNGCASATIVESTASGVCKPTYANTGASITVIDRNGDWSRCATTGQCGYAVFMASGTGVAAENCSAVAAAACTGYYEVVHISPGSQYDQCSTSVVDNVCCLASSLVVCRKTICFSSPVKVTAATCGSGSAGTTCGSYTTAACT